MPITDTHPEYDLWVNRWQRCRDVISGSDDIKAAGSKYLPVPGGLTEDSDRYLAYKARAKWFGATQRTIEGLEGEVFRNNPQIEMPDSMQDIMDDYTLTGMTAEQFYRETLTERLTVGRYGEWVDWSDQLNRPYSIGFCAENIINWGFFHEPGPLRLQFVVLAEKITVPDTDMFDTKTMLRYRLLIIENGIYVVRVYEADTVTPTTTQDFQRLSATNEAIGEPVLTEEYIPTIRGQRMTMIPFFFFGVSENTPRIEKPPLLDLVDLNLADYRNSADLEHGRHFCGLPMHYIFGAHEYADDGAPVAIGSGEALVSLNENAKAGIVEFSGTGLGALEKAREENRVEMALMGAKLLEETKRAGETAEAIARRQSGKASVLQGMVEVQDQGHERALKKKAEWMGISEEISVSLNKDYVVTKMEAQEVTALVAAWQGGAMSKASLFWNLQQGERVPPDTTFDEEMAAIASEAPDMVVDFSPEAAGG